MAETTGILIAQLLSLFLSSLFWGIFLITFIQSIRCLLWDSKGIRKSASIISWPMLIVAVLLALFPTFDVALGLAQNIEAIKSFASPINGSAARLPSALTNWSIILKTCNLVVGKLISDGAWVYRCWVVHNRKWLIIAFPTFLWLSYLCLSIYAICEEVQSAGNPLLVFTGSTSSRIVDITASAWAISLVNNFLTNGLIVHRIRQVDKENSMYTAAQDAGSVRTRIHIRTLFDQRQRTRLQNVMLVIIESGLLYTTVALISFIAFLSGSTSFYATSSAEIQILSIAFNLVIIRSARPNDDVQMSTGRNHPTFPLRSLVIGEDAAEVSSMNEETWRGGKL
ncbi:hypothetical protein BT96DRAFT_977270 [Gymnopus androsaceus JB14]|uniref:Uncharacterized protein n=1 Tax=Gymnopus androsaceus JB14 TaxID=1447944 RepID=A0A6A4HGZ1_9AGAR|nr:hypothetical protein BT96DRAFT_977270 [Gymnopus androsaceus JB14]